MSVAMAMYVCACLDMWLCVRVWIRGCVAVCVAMCLCEGLQGAGQVGPIIDVAAKERCIRYIAESEANGAQILLDGRAWCDKSPGNWVRAWTRVWCASTSAVVVLF